MKLLDTPLSNNNDFILQYFDGSGVKQQDINLLSADAFVTPQMFGAVADGTTDCTAAIQAAVDSGKTVVFPAGTYKMNGTVTFYNKNKYVFDAMSAMISYAGSSYAFEIIKCENCFLRFGSIATTTGGCIHFSVDGNTINPNFTTPISGSVGTQYINIEFGTMVCNDSDIVYDTTDPDNPVYLYNKYDCIHGEQANNGTSNWCNEIRINNGRFIRGQAVRLVQHEAIANGRFNAWKFDKVGFEGYASHPVKGFRVDASSASTVKSGYSFINCRNEADDVDYVMDFTADGYNCTVSGVYIYGPLYVGETQFKFTSKTSGDIIAPYKPTTTLYGQTECRIVNGYIVPSHFESRLATSSTSDHSDKLPYQLNRYIYVNNSGVTSLTLPDYYFVRKGGINDFYIKFQHAKTNFDIKVNRAGTVTTYGTISSVSADDVIHVVWFGNNLNDETTTLLLFTPVTSV